MSGSNGGEGIFPSGLEEVLKLFCFRPTLLSLYVWGNRGTEGPVTCPTSPAGELISGTRASDFYLSSGQKAGL